MTRDALLAEILRLPADERLKLLESVWDRAAASPDEVPVPEWHRDEIDRRLDDPAERAEIPWPDVQARLDRPPK